MRSRSGSAVINRPGGYMSALDYEIPREFISRDEQQPQQEQVEPSSELGHVEDPNHPLASRGKLTSDYYNNYAQLDQYAKHMAKDFGIDVFKPDYSQEGGGEAFQLAHKLQANVMYAANALKNEFSAEKERRKQIEEGKLLRKHGVDYNNTLAYSNDDNFIPTQALPGVNEANMRGREDTYDSQSSARINAVITQQGAQIDQLVQSGQLSPEEGQLQKSYLTKNAHKLSVSQLTDDGGSGGKIAKSMIPMFERVTNITRGVLDDGRDTIVRGKHYLASPALSGDNYGEIQIKKTDKLGNESQVKVPKIIKRVLKNSQGDVYFEYEDHDIPIEKVSSSNPDEVFRRLVESNSGKYGGQGSLPQFYEELRKKGYLQEDRSVHPGTVYGQGSVEKAQVKPQASGFDKVLEFDKNRFAGLESGKSDKVVADTPKGQYVFKFDPDRGVYLDNWKDFGSKRIDNISYDEYLKMMDKAGYHEGLLNSHKEVVDSASGGKGLSPTQEKAIAAFTKQFNRTPTESELAKILAKY